MGADRGVGSRIFTGSGIVGDNWRQPVRVRDNVSASKPTGAVNIDGITPLVNGDRVLFTNLSGAQLADNNKVFRAVVSGGLVTSWNLDTDGQSGGSPQDGNIIYVKEGTTFGDKLYKWTGAGWSEIGAGGGAFANQQLSNLIAPTAINASMLPSVSSNFDVGSPVIPWLNFWGNRFYAVAGTAASPSFSFGSDTTIGIFSPGANTLSMAVGGAGRVNFTTNAILPVTNLGVSIGSDGSRFNDLNVQRIGVGGTLNGFYQIQTSFSDGTGLPFSHISGGVSTRASVQGGALQIYTTGTGTPGTVSGLIYLATGNQSASTSTATGLINVLTGNITNASNGGTTGIILLKTGDTTGTGGSGNITLQTGAVTSGSRGTIRFVDASLTGSSVGWVWTLQDTATGRGAWQAAGGGGGTPGGASGTVQFNNAGTFGGDSLFTWDNVAKALTVGSTGSGTTGITILKSQGATLTCQVPANVQQYFTLTSPSYTAFIGVESSGGTGIFGGGNGFALAIGHVTNAPINFHTNNVSTPRFQIGSTALVHSVDILPNVSSTINIGSTSLRYNDMWARRTLLTNPNPGGVSNVFIIADSDTSEAFLIQMNPAGGLPTGATNVGVLVKSGLRTTLRNFVVTTDVDGVANASATGAIWISTGNKTAGTGNSGSINIITGTSAGGTRGSIVFSARALDISASPITNNVSFLTASTTTFGSSSIPSGNFFGQTFLAMGGNFIVRTAPGSSTNVISMGINVGTLPSGASYQSGIFIDGSDSFAIFTNSDISASATPTRSVRIETGNKTAGTGDSGSIIVQTGTSAGGNRGSVILNARQLDVTSISEGKGLPIWKKYTVSHAALQAAALTNSITLFGLPAYGVIKNVVISHTVAFAGTGITAYTIEVGITGNTAKYASPFDVFQAPGAGVGQTSSVADFESKGGSTNILVTATSVGANLDQSTGGTVEIWVLWGTMQ